MNRLTLSKATLKILTVKTSAAAAAEGFTNCGHSCRDTISLIACRG